jgi:hypothetical protein
MAIVLDAHGASAGTVTLEDLLEEIVGEIADEYHLPDESIRWIDDRTVHVAGSFPIDDFNERFGVRLPHTGFHTLAGLAFDTLGRAPTAWRRASPVTVARGHRRPPDTGDRCDYRGSAPGGVPGYSLACRSRVSAAICSVRAVFCASIRVCCSDIVRSRSVTSASRVS